MTGTALRSDLLRASLRGMLVEPGDPEYDRRRSLHNGDIDRRPACIVRCATVGDVVAALAFARGNGLEVAVRGGGHSASGASSCDGGLVVDLGLLQDVRADPVARRARCQGGATMAHLDAATQEHGLAVTGGTISSTGVGGLALGGGYGWLTRKAGLLIDNLVSAQVVLADGAVVRASAEEHPDLFWALRGGGGNFGVVTEFEFALHPVGPQVRAASFFWALDRRRAALRLARDVCDGLSREAGALVAALNAPPAPFVPEEQHLAPGILLVVVGFGALGEHEALADRIRSALPPTYELAEDLPYTALQQMIDSAGPWGFKAYSKGLFLDDLTDRAIDVISEHLPRKRSPMSVMPLFPLGGAYSDVAVDDTALAGRRAARWNVSIDAIAPTADLLATDRAWVRALWTALRPFASDAGGYINFMAEYEDDRVRAAFGAKYERLARIKARYDPANVFHLNANIRPAPDR